MPLTFLVPGYLRVHTNGLSEVRVETPARTVAEALAALWKAYPGLRDRVMNELGEIRQHVNIFVGEENIRDREGLKTAVRDSDSVMIVPAVSGG